MIVYERFLWIFTDNHLLYSLYYGDYSLIYVLTVPMCKLVLVLSYKLTMPRYFR